MKGPCTHLAPYPPPRVPLELLKRDRSGCWEQLFGRTAHWSSTPSRAAARFSASVFFRASHSQTTTTRIPSCSSRFFFMASRRELSSNLVDQNRTFVLGTVAYLQLGCLCQKHPWTKIANFRRTFATSGEPGSERTLTRYRTPRRVRALRTRSSAEVPC